MVVANELFAEHSIVRHLNAEFVTYCYVSEIERDDVTEKTNS